MSSKWKMSLISIVLGAEDGFLSCEDDRTFSRGGKPWEN